MISAQKANTATAFSLDSSSSSNGRGSRMASHCPRRTSSAVQPGGSLYGLQHSNPVDTGSAYQGPASRFGHSNDPGREPRRRRERVRRRPPLYNAAREVVGGVGASGDTSCADHNIAWRVRHNLNLDFLAGVGGVSGDATRPDNIVFDITANPAGGTGNSAGGFGHPTCLNTAGSATLPTVQ